MTDLQNQADVVFLALVIWREARGESAEAMCGVGHAILNRVQRPSWWGRSVSGVLFKKWQFSSMTDPNDKQLTTWPIQDDKSWYPCLSIASAVLTGAVPNPVPGADSYFDISIPAPAWTSQARFCRKIGRINFYDVDHDYEVAK
jgi:spore germination cell wall hydrolase CwlJ-like protein